MPIIYEVFGFLPDDESDSAKESRYNALCPFTNSQCDGGGNRHQTKIKLEASDLRNSFNPALASVVPGVCSIRHADKTWIVCPRRLLGFAPTKDTVLQSQILQEHEQQALLAAGLPAGVELGVWPEVYLNYGDDESTINYHFDFVISRLQRRKSLNSLFSSYPEMSEDEKEMLLSIAKKSRYVTGRMNIDSEADILPDLASPYIVEVMTASTSGSDTSAGTDIASAFKALILGKNHTCPGINKRQVWGRMATQLFAKSALADAWGGKTIWIVQDELLNNIELTTKMNTTIGIAADAANVISFVSLGYQHDKDNIESLKVNGLHEKEAGIDFDGSGKCVDILLPKIYPRKQELLKSVLRRRVAAIIKL
jgi:hypothetical protein